jgi:hypothetical protein
MSGGEAESVSLDKEVPDEAKLGLIDEDDESLEPDDSDESEAEAGMSDGGAEPDSTEEVIFEEDESGVAR